MKALKFFSDFTNWRWAPSVALVGGTLLYILLVLLFVPDEVGLPGVNTKFSSRSTHGGSTSDAGAFASPDHSGTLGNTAAEVAAPPSPAPPPGDFGRRGFSPPMGAPDAPPPAEAVPPPAPEAPPPPPAPEPPPPAAPEPAAQPEPPPPPPAAVEPPAQEMPVQ